MSRNAPKPSSDAARRRMKATKQRDTDPEMALRSELHGRGLRYFVDRSPIDEMRGRADLVFPTPRVAVFVDGCFWHGCPEHGTLPKANGDWWAEKLAANQRRDEAANQTLREAGWKVLRFWEHEEAEDAADVVERIVRQRLRDD